MSLRSNARTTLELPPHLFVIGAERQAEAGRTSGHGPRFTVTSNIYIHELYEDLLSEEDARHFLEHSSKYDSIKKTWFPGGVSTHQQLLGSALQVFASILQRLGERNTPEIGRRIVKVDSLYDRSGESSHLAIQASGPSFQGCNLADGPTSRCQSSTPKPESLAAYILIKMDAELGSASDSVKEVEDYAQGLFRSQPNRFFVRTLILTESRARLVHFDRAGAQITPDLDIHGHPGTLIRLILGLASRDERLLGIDDSVQWTLVDDRKGKGILTTQGLNGESKAYSILEQIPIPNEVICGRGTTCWRVWDPETGEECVVKDSWRPEEWASEHQLLELVKGIPGVVQMVSYQTGHLETSTFRCPSTSGMYHNRIATRIVTKAYGKSVEQFSSVLQLLYAIRDAIAGHRRLMDDRLKIIHRDVSLNNILLGNEGAPEGYRGILIDLELAFKATLETPLVKANHDIGTRTFQSLPVLASCTVSERNNVPHGYLDDLESFFYVLVYLFLVSRPDGSPRPPQDPTRSIAYSWGLEQPGSAASNKYELFDYGKTARVASSSIKETWGPACFKLFEDYRDWLMDMTFERRSLWRERDFFDEDLSNPLKSLEPFLSRREEHYSEVLKMLDDAIEATKASATASPPPVEVAIHPQPSIAMSHDEATLVSEQPAPGPTASPSQSTTHPRRSTRLRDLKTSRQQRPRAHSVQPPIGDHPLHVTSPPTNQPRRSARLDKRRHLNPSSDVVEARPSKVRRTKNSSRAPR